ncbi:MAG: DedA family protein [Sandaracinobacteroides sp.]
MHLSTIENSLSLLQSQPILAFLVIVGFTYLLEDATAIAAGALAMAGKLDPALALTALLIGTVSGDLLLHGVGRLARRNAWVARQVARHCGLQRAGRSIATVAAARFVPGLRTPAYIGSGLVGLPFAHLFAVVSLTAIVWTPLLFVAGSAITMGGYGPVLAGGALAGMLLGPWFVRQFRKPARVQQPACG